MRDFQCTLRLYSNVQKTYIMAVKGTSVRMVMYDISYIMADLVMVVISYITLSLMLLSASGRKRQ